MQDRFSIDREEFQDFLAENKRLVERYKKLLDELGRLRNLNEDLEEKLRLAEKKIGSPEQKLNLQSR